MFQAFARQNGQDLMNRDGNRTNYAHPDVIAALQYWRDLGAKHKVMPEGPVEWGTLRQAFTEGKTAMMWHTTGNLTAVKGSAKFPFGVAMLPASKQRGSPTGGGNFYLFKKTTPEERKAALAFVQFHDRARARRRLEHGHRLRGHLARGLRHAEAQGLRVEFPPAVVARDQFQYATPDSPRSRRAGCASSSTTPSRPRSPARSSRRRAEGGAIGSRQAPQVLPLTSR